MQCLQIQWRHVNYHKSGNQCFIQFLRSRITVIHRTNKTCCRMQLYSGISRYINASSMIQCGMKHGYRVILCHINLIENTKTAVLCTFVNRSLSKLNFIIFKSICTYQCCTVCIHMKGNIIGWSSKHPGKCLAEDIFPCCLCSR